MRSLANQHHLCLQTLHHCTHLSALLAVHLPFCFCQSQLPTPSTSRSIGTFCGQVGRPGGQATETQLVSKLGSSLIQARRMRA